MRGVESVKPTDKAALVLTDPSAFADEQRLHSALTHLRACAPVSWVDQSPYAPFWAITKHADITEIERNNTVWINEPRSVLAPAKADEAHRLRRRAGTGFHSLLEMDGAHHRAVRAIGVDWFRPKAMRTMKDRISSLARRYVDQMSNTDACDFVTDIAVNYPLYAIMSLLGVPEADFPYMLKLTQEAFGSDDAEYQSGESDEDVWSASEDSFAYFSAMVAARRERPTDDLASVIANARINGEYLTDAELLSYYVVIATAGHDTTSAVISGGMQALIENPAQREQLCKHPDLMPTAVEEMIRWTTPVKEFMRTATEDTTVRGIPIAAGESAYLAYTSANRDEEVFNEPSRFDITRDPNKHLAFGHGVHFCFGASLAPVSSQVIGRRRPA